MVRGNKITGYTLFVDMEHQRLCPKAQTNKLCKDEILAELISMGFELPAALEAIQAVGHSLSDAVEFILAGNSFNTDECKNDITVDPTYLLNSHVREKCSVGDMLGSCSSVHTTKQLLIAEKFQPTERLDNSSSHGRHGNSSTVHVTGNARFELLEKQMVSLPCQTDSGRKSDSPTEDPRQQMMFRDTLSVNTSCLDTLHCQESNLNWENKANVLLHRYFGHTALKPFQKEALKAWAVHQDCLVLAATGLGKSLCFQLPALISGKVVVVISPLISLMHDQCLKLARHRVSACFLGSGQVDKSVEDRAMAGMYDIIYVCPETVLRLVWSLQKLAENRGIALFAIDEVHCISKWGHDFRPDYRRLFVLKENFKAGNFKSPTYDIPIMGLTATATPRVQEDILDSLGIKANAKIVLTSFFRPNLRFSVHHSKTSRVSSYGMDFRELIYFYTQGGSIALRRNNNETGVHVQNSDHGIDKKRRPVNEKVLESDETSLNESESYEEEIDDYDLNSKASSTYEDVQHALERHQLTVEYLENEHDEQIDEDFDVAFGEFKGHLLKEDRQLGPDQSVLGDEILADLEGTLGQGPSVIYMPTRKETERLAKFLCKSGVKAAAYHAKLAKRHLRQVHEQFHSDSLQVVVATIAFGMGIDKPNVRRIIHYGWPQSLEAYYQEAGRAGRDGLLAECTLYADLTRIPSLLPSRRDAEQTRQALNMLSECFRYGVSTTCCRAKALLKYFGEDLIGEKCNLCDICVNGPPKLENLTKEAVILLKVLIELQKTVNRGTSVPFKVVIDNVREQYEEVHAKSMLWWRGFGRLLEDKGFIREVDNTAALKRNHQRALIVKYPEPTVLGLEFLKSWEDINFNGNRNHGLINGGCPPLCLCPEGDMLQAMKTPKLSSQSGREWGKGWADPEIRQQRLGRKGWGKKRKRASRKPKTNLNTVRGRLSAKISRKKHRQSN